MSYKNTVICFILIIIALNYYRYIIQFNKIIMEVKMEIDKTKITKPKLR